MTEDAIHMQLVAELRYAGLIADTDFFHCPNGGKCSKAEADRRKRRGVCPGVPDLIFTAPGLPRALEIKTLVGRVSKAQKAWIAAHVARGWDVRVGRGLEACRAILREWGYLPATAAARVE